MRKLAYFSSLLVIFTIPWEEAFTIGSFGTVTRIVGLLTMILWLGALLSHGIPFYCLEYYEPHLER